MAFGVSYIPYQMPVIHGLYGRGAEQQLQRMVDLHDRPADNLYDIDVHGVS